MFDGILWAMQVWIVSATDFGLSKIVAVFDSEAGATQFVKEQSQPENYQVESFEVQSIVIP